MSLQLALLLLNKLGYLFTASGYASGYAAGAKFGLLYAIGGTLITLTVVIVIILIIKWLWDNGNGWQPRCAT